MHKVTGFYFFSHKDGRKFVIYSTYYKEGRIANTFDCTGMTEAQARGAFLIDHSHMVDKQLNQIRKSKIVLA